MQAGWLKGSCVLLECTALRVVRQDQCLVSVDKWTAPKGEIVVVIGPSGAGKTTLLRCCAGLEAYEGSISVDGQPPARGDVGFVFQHFNLFPHFTVMDNLIRIPLLRRLASRELLCARATDYLETFGLQAVASRYPHQLSGGQKQRVALMRTLMTAPTVVLLDEPTSALDPEAVNDVAACIRQLQSTDKTIVIVTHEIRLAQQVASRIVFMDKGIILDDCPAADFFEAHHLSARARTYLTNLTDYTPSTR